MTRDDLVQWVWHELPMRKVMLGRRRVRALTELAIENWEGENFAASAGRPAEEELVVKSVVNSIRRMDEVMSEEDSKQYGFLWLLLLSGLVSLIVQLLVKWWSAEEKNRVLMAGWQREMTR